MSRPMFLSHDQAQALELGAAFCRTLAAVEHAHTVGDEQDVETILAGVDPIEAKLTANALQGLWMLWKSLPQDRGRTKDAWRTGGKLDRPVSEALSSAQPSAPTVAEAAVIPLDTYSRRVPCE